MKTILVTLLVVYSLVGFSQEKYTFKDLRDGNVYKTIKIGTQIVMAENLAYQPNSGKYWTYDNDTTNRSKYGYLYDWETAQKVVPKGWHLPTKTELEKLFPSLGKDSCAVFNQVKNGGTSGLNVLLGGCRSSSGSFFGLEEYGYFWTATLYDAGRAWRFDCSPYDTSASLYYSNCALGFSVRLFKD